MCAQTPTVWVFLRKKNMSTLNLNWTWCNRHMHTRAHRENGGYKWQTTLTLLVCREPLLKTNCSRFSLRVSISLSHFWNYSFFFRWKNSCEKITFSVNFCIKGKMLHSRARSNLNDPSENSTWERTILNDFCGTMEHLAPNKYLSWTWHSWAIAR